MRLYSSRIEAAEDSMVDSWRAKDAKGREGGKGELDVSLQEGRLKLTSAPSVSRIPLIASSLSSSSRSCIDVEGRRGGDQRLRLRLSSGGREGGREDEQAPPPAEPDTQSRTPQCSKIGKRRDPE